MFITILLTLSLSVFGRLCPEIYASVELVKRMETDGRGRLPEIPRPGKLAKLAHAERDENYLSFIIYNIALPNCFYSEQKMWLGR